MKQYRRKKTRREQAQERSLHEAYVALDQLTRHETRETGYARIVRLAKHELNKEQLKLLLRRASEFTQFDEPTQHQYLKLLMGIMEATSHDTVQGSTFKAILNASLRCLKVPRFWDTAADTLAVLLLKAHKIKEFLHVADSFCQLILRLNAKVASEQAGIATAIGRISFYIPLYEYGEIFDTLLEAMLEFLQGTSDSASLTCGYLALSNIPKSNPTVYLRNYCVSVFDGVCELEQSYAVSGKEFGPAAAAAFECVEIWVSHALETLEVTELSSKLTQIRNWAMELAKQSKIPHLREAALFAASAIEQRLGIPQNTEREEKHSDIETEGISSPRMTHEEGVESSPIRSEDEFIEGRFETVQDGCAQTLPEKKDAHGLPSANQDERAQALPEKKDINDSGNSHSTLQSRRRALNLANLASSAYDTVQFGIEHANKFFHEKQQGKTDQLPWEILLPIECLHWRDWRKLPQRITDNYVNSLCHAILLILRDKNRNDIAFEDDPELDQHTQGLASKFLLWLQQWQQVGGDVFKPFSASARTHLYEMLLLFSGMGSADEFKDVENTWTGVRQRAAALLVNFNCDTDIAV